MYLGFWRPVALKPAPLLGVGRKCALELSNSGLIVGEGRARRGLVFDGRRGRLPRGAPVPAGEDSEEIMKIETLLGPLRSVPGAAGVR